MENVPANSVNTGPYGNTASKAKVRLQVAPCGVNTRLRCSWPEVWLYVPPLSAQCGPIPSRIQNPLTKVWVVSAMGSNTVIVTLLGLSTSSANVLT